MTVRRAAVTLVLTLLVAWGSVAALLGAGLRPKLGLDLQGGFEVVLVAPEGTDRATLEQAVAVMRRRIENIGSVQEPEIAVEGQRRILVQLPGVAERERALQAVGSTGELSFRPVLEVADPSTPLTQPDDPAAEAVLEERGGGIRYRVGPAFLTGKDLKGGKAQIQGSALAVATWVVVPEFTDEGGTKFREATKELASYPPGDPRRQLAIVVDGVVISAPQVAPEVSPAEGLDPNAVVITIGSAEDPEAEARDLAAILRYGALPTTFERERVESVSASLGADSLQAGLIAGIAGLVLVALYMLVYYRALGLVNIVGLTVFGSLVTAVIILVGEVQGLALTLAGVTGVIVSVGITSDSYIVYFERIKEEVRRGRPMRPSVDHAFRAAFRTVLTGDTVTFLGAILLWFLAVGPVKGFALTLGIATLVDIGVAWFFTRPAVALLVRSSLGEGGWVSIRGAVGDHEPAAQTAEVAG